MLSGPVVLLQIIRELRPDLAFSAAYLPGFQPGPLEQGLGALSVYILVRLSPLLQEKKNNPTGNCPDQYHQCKRSNYWLAKFWRPRKI